MELRPVQTQVQQLKMTTELRQAISLLQYSTQELAEYIREISLENPLIELNEPKPDVPMTYSDPIRAAVPDLSEFARQKEAGLEEVLLQQVRLLSLTEDQMERVTTLIFYLDPDGYFREDFQELSHDLGCSLEAIEEALTLIQELEPAGVGARNLQECLTLQYKRLHPHDQLAQQLIMHHLEEIASRDLEALAERYDMTEETIEEILACIQTLNPKPGLLYETEAPVYIRADVVVEATGEGYEVRLVEDLLPTIHYNSQYQHLFSDREALHFLKPKYKEMLWLKKSIEQRQSTLLKISKTIMDQQVLFLAKGPHYIAPLTLKEIAEILGIHESTVSRTVRNKYIQTPQGVFELKHFFSSRIHTSAQTDLSSTSVKKMLQEMVEQEDKKNPLSDQGIVQNLKRTFGIEISRRTVAKYRQVMKIPSSSKRKQ
nr:RNA polymerase factor sigma-54 [Pullulanibacillus pueri]